MSCQVNFLFTMLITLLKLLILWYAPFCVFWLYTALPTQRFLINYKLSTEWHMLARDLFHSLSSLCFLLCSFKACHTLKVFSDNWSVALRITLQLFRSYQNLPPTSISLWLGLVYRFALISTICYKVEYLEYRSVIWTGKLKRLCSCMMGEVGRTVITRLLFCPYRYRKCSWLLYSNMLYETPGNNQFSPASALLLRG